MILDNNSLDPSQTFKTKTQLFRHQLKAIRALQDIEKEHRIDTVVYNNSIAVVRTNFAVYADKVGAGKTLTMVSLITSCNKPTPRYNVPSLSSSNYTMTITNPINDDTSYHMDATLIIVPHNLVLQWRSCLNKFENIAFKVIKSKKDMESFSIQNYSPIILVSNTQAVKFLSKVVDQCGHSLNWNRVIIDEPQTLNNLIGAIEYMNANFTWFVCATPRDLFAYYPGKPTYLNSSCYFSRDGPRYDDLRGCLVVKNNDTFIEESLSLPPYNRKFILCKAPSYYNAVRNVLPSNEALERLQANDIQGAIATFNCESGTEENIIETLTKFYLEKIQKLNYSSKVIDNDPFMDRDRKDERIQKINEKIDEINKKVDSIKRRISKDEEELTCPICFDEVSNPRAITKCCQNSFCMNCILITLSSGFENCPLCKEHLTNNDLIIENTHTEVEDDGVEEEKTDVMPKLKYKNKALKSFIENITPDQKIIIFSEYDRTFDIFKADIENTNIKSTILKGRVETQTRIIHAFNSGEIQVIMLNANYCGSGLNLQMATDIIVYHKLPPSVEKQVIGRAQRPGRTGPLNVTYLHYEDEYSE